MSGRVGQFLAVVVVGTALGVAIAGVPDRSRDEPLQLTPGASTTMTTLTTVPSPSTTVAPVPTTTLRPPSQVRVITLNASGVAGVARRVTGRLQAAGYAVAAPADSPRRYQRTEVLHRPGVDGEAAAVAALLGLSPKAVVPMPDPRPVRVPEAADVAVMVGADRAAVLAQG